MTTRPSRYPQRPRRRGSRRAALALFLSLGTGLTGCGREFFRNWADQDVSEAVFEKSRDPRWRIDLFSIEPPAMARFADPYDPDRPPAPPDDRAAEAVSPVPQWPHHRLLVPMEGTGYLDLLEAWRREAPPETEQETKPAIAGNAPFVTPRSEPAPPPETPAPFERPATPEATPAPGVMPDNYGDEASPPPPPAPGGAAVSRTGSQVVARNQGQTKPVLTPIPSSGKPGNTPSIAQAASPKATSVTSKPSTTSRTRDQAVQLSAFQAAPAVTPPTSVPMGTQATGAAVAQPGQGGMRTPDDLELVPLAPSGGLDPNPIEVDLSKPANARDAQGEGEGEGTQGLSGLLAPTDIPYDPEEIAGLAKGSQPYVVTPRQAMTLALVNSRAYQSQLEEVYLRALDVTLQRWRFQPQVIAGLSPTSGTSAGTPGPNFQNSFLYRTNEVQGGNSQTSTLSLGTLLGFGKALSFGGNILAGFANQVVFNFTGSNPIQPRIQSVLPLNYVQPFLRGGGRAVALEPLTGAERNLLYQVRNFARFRQTFFPNVLTSAQALQAGVGGGGGGLVGDGNIGYLQVLQQLQSVENTRKTVAAFEQLLSGFVEMAQGGGSGVSQLDVDQIDDSLQAQRGSLITQLNVYRNILDQYKIQLGLPPDVPLVLDRTATKPFRDTFDVIDEWFTKENRDPADLPELVDTLPPFADVDLDGRSLKELGKDPHRLEELLLAAERLALENRFDLMNARGQLYDQWRQLAVTANALKGVFNVSINNQYLTPNGVGNPFGFTDQSNQFNVTINAELPLVRLNERNLFRVSLISYRRQQRTLMQLEDTIKLQVRTGVRDLVQQSEQYDIRKRQLVINLRRKDNTQRVIFAPPGAGDQGSGNVTAQTQQLVTAQNGLLSAQNELIRIWVGYNTARIALYRDLGIIPYDEWEAFYELFPAESQGSGIRDANTGRAAAPTPTPVEPPA